MSEALDTAPVPRVHWRLLLASFAALYFELLFIRWLPSAIHVLGYFTNLVLIATFLGLGLGVAREGRRKDGAGFALLSVLGLVAVNMALHIYRIEVVAPNNQYYINQQGALSAASWSVSFYAVIATVFVATALTFVPLGQVIGEHLRPLPTLEGYGVNILGSLLGIAGFTALSALSTPPAVWVAVGIAAYAPLLPRPAWGVLGALAAGLMVHGTERIEATQTQTDISWSPYYNIHRSDLPDPTLGSIIRVNYNFLLTAFDFSGESPGAERARQRNYYALPYAFVQPRRLLVLGAGAGNDVLAALMHHVDSVTAVEIDPQVARIGRDVNPAHPLRDPRVHVVIDDARAFLRNDPGEYDAIVFGALDSHSVFSSMSNVRLENFVYTRECFRDAIRHLSPQGVLLVSVGEMAPWVHLRIERSLELAAGMQPVLYHDAFGNVAMVVGPASKPLDNMPIWTRMDPAALEAQRHQYPEAEVPATDNWPNIFVRQPGLPLEYAVALGLIVVLSAGVVRLGLPGRGLNVELFLLGTGFLLLETKSITELALVFGATWVVSSVVIAIILAVILLAIWCSQWRRFPRLRTYPALLLVLGACYSIPVSSLAVGGLPMRLLLSFLFVGVPVFLTSLVFSDAYRDVPDPRPAFASNLLGSVLGGVLEYAAMVYGHRALYLLAIATYGACLGMAWWSLKHGALSTRTSTEMMK